MINSQEYMRNKGQHDGFLLINTQLKRRNLRNGTNNYMLIKIKVNTSINVQYGRTN